MNALIGLILLVSIVCALFIAYPWPIALIITIILIGVANDN